MNPIKYNNYKPSTIYTDYGDTNGKYDTNFLLWRELIISMDFFLRKIK